MITAQDVFISAMNLMDEDTEDGTYTGYPEEYKKKAWTTLTLLQAELTPASTTPSAITSEASVFSLDDRSCLTILPYGLAAQLLLNEDQNRAAYFNNRYDELKRKKKAVITPIKDVYGIVPQETEETPTVETPVDDSSDDGVIDGGEWS